ncbi:hypothetical protein B9T19_03800 [Ignatzschineria sp. F8392]|uniref:LPO_1073/Vpar_1526 family protein n=1 Tax=Ignatzschineria sp. F8392 TaxID=1980117 RepID=UPI000B989E0E|nr:LPO_1073/Vpar_1526 family protein [Ignatzschineria sp. F8392]OYQ81796.1 hypothetical protein B9T19_03800 [Ignatzschineria sp. F8392]
MNQKAIAKSDSKIIQAGRDVNYGLSMTEVERLFQLLFNENMPHLQEKAFEKAQDNINLLIEEVRQEFTQKIDSINLQLLTEPDVQSAINDAVLGAAKKGEKIDLSVLASLVVDRMNDGHDDFFYNSLEESIKIIPKISKDLLSALALNYFIKNLTLKDPTLKELEEAFTWLRKNFLIHCKNITDTRLMTLESIGAVNHINMMRGNTLKEYVDEKYASILSNVNLRKNVPNLRYVLNQYDNLDLHKITLTFPGILIASKLLEPYFGSIPLPK